MAGVVGLPHDAATRVLGSFVLGTDTDLSDLLGHYSPALVRVDQIMTLELWMGLFNAEQRALVDCEAGTGIPSPKRPD